MDLVLLFELYRSIIIGQRSTNQIAQYMVEVWRGFHLLFLMLRTFRRPLGDFRRVFKHCRKWHSYNAKISRRLQIFVLQRLAHMQVFDFRWKIYWYISSQMKTWWCFIQCFIRYQDLFTWPKWSSVIGFWWYE